MRCTIARGLATRRLRETLPAADETALDAHLASCAACREEAAGLQRLEAALRRRPVADAAVETAVRVDTAAILRQGRPNVPRLPWAGLVLAGTAVGAAVVTGLLLLPARNHSVARTPEAPALPRRNRTATPQHEEAPVVRNIPHPAVGLKTVQRPAPKPGIEAPQLAQALRRSPVSLQRDGIRPALQSQQPKEPGLEGVRVPGLHTPSQEAPPFPAPEPEEESSVVLIQNDPGADGLAVTDAERKRVAQSEAMLRADPRLSARVTVAQKDRLLSEWLPQLGQRLKVSLAAAREVADDKATLFAKERPAAESMIRLARQFGFLWRRTEGGYELGQELAARNREARLRLQDLEPIRADVAEYTRLAALPNERHKARVEEIDGLLKGGNLKPGEEQRLKIEKQRHLNAWLSPDALQAALALFRSLGSRQGAELLSGSALRFSTADGTLPAPMAEKVYGSASIFENQYGPLSREQADVTVQLLDVEEEEDVPPSRRNRGLRLRFEFATVRGPKEDRHYFGGGWAFPFPGLETPTDTREEAPQDPRLDQQVELVLPGPERQPLTISGGNPVLLACTGAVWPQQATVGDVAQAIHRATGLEVLADSFTAARIDPARLRGRRSLREVLETVAKELDYDWKLEGNLLKLRSRRFHWDRFAEAPERVVRPFRERVVRQGATTLDDLAGLAAALTDPQARSLYRYWGWYMGDPRIVPPGYFYAHRQHLRLWAALTGVQKQSLLKGEVLPVGQMTPAQQALWTRAFLSPPVDHRTPASELRTPSTAEVMAGGFSLHKVQTQQLLFSQVVEGGEGGRRRVATSISIEGPPTLDARKYHHSDVEMEMPLPQMSIDEYRFGYHLGGGSAAARKAEVEIAPLLPIKR